MSDTVTLWAATHESLDWPLWVTGADPTGTAPQFGLTPPDSDTAPDDLVAGSWHPVGWNAADGACIAVTPTIGAAGALEVEAGQTYRVWLKVTAGSETAVWPVGAIRVR